MILSAIVPVWNGRELLKQLLASLEVQTRRADELVVVDNGSDDGAPEVARAAGARVIPIGRNAGFAAAVNIGIRESRGEWLAVLNSDVELAPDYFEKLLAADGWFATGKILRRLDGAGTPPIIDGTFDVLSRGGTAWRVGNGYADGPVFSEGRTIFSPPWTAALFRAELFRKVGWLEESFESYLEDVDFGLRCQWAGMSGRYVPGAIAWHRGSAALGRWHPETVRRISRNQVFLLARHYPVRMLLRWMWPIAMAQGLWGMVALRHGTGWAWVRGKCQGLSGFRSARKGLITLEPHLLDQAISESERIIRCSQRATGFDSYWRLYFLLTGGAK